VIYIKSETLLLCRVEILLNLLLARLKCGEGRELGEISLDYSFLNHLLVIHMKSSLTVGVNRIYYDQRQTTKTSCFYLPSLSISSLPNSKLFFFSAQARARVQGAQKELQVARG